MTGGDTITQTYLAIEGMHGDERASLFGMLDSGGYLAELIERWVSGETERDEDEIADLEAEVKRLELALHHATYQPLGRRIESLRRAKGWTMSELAECAGISTCMVSMVERGQRKARTPTLQKLATALGIEIDELRRAHAGTDDQAEKMNDTPKVRAGKTLAERLRIHRKARAWSRADLAERCGLHEHNIRDMESGRSKPLQETIERMAMVLGVQPSALTGKKRGRPRKQMA